MFNVGDFVVRKNNYVVCEIVGVEQNQLVPGAPKEEYLVLKSVFDSTERRIPVNKAEAFYNHAMKKDEAEAFVRAIAEKEYVWNPNDDKNRANDSKKVLENDSSIEVLGDIVGAYYSRLAKGKSISRADKNLLDLAEGMLLPALGFSLEKPVDEVRGSVRGAFGIHEESESES